MRPENFANACAQGQAVLGAAPQVERPSAHAVLLGAASDMRINADRLLARAGRLEVFYQTIPGIMPERAADAIRTIFGLTKYTSLHDAAMNELDALRSRAAHLLNTAESYELLERSLPQLMPVDAHEAVLENLGGVPGTPTALAI